jgi:putative phosphoribosyl transferase
MTLFADRQEAGRALGAVLVSLRAEEPLLLALPRGGVPVARGIREVLGTGDLDLVLVRKLGVPWQPELAMGAIGEGAVRCATGEFDTVRVLNREVLRGAHIAQAEFDRVERIERAELKRRAEALRRTPDGEPLPRIPIAGRTAVIVDDGVATGATATAACRVVRAQRPQRLVVAVPVTSPAAAARLRAESDRVVFLAAPEDLGGVGAAYRDFHQLDDREVVDLLRVVL